MELKETKILCMVLLGVISLLIGGATWGLSNYLEVKKQGKKRTVFTSLLLCFGAGVLLATGLLHILPEAREGLEERGHELKIRWLAELCIFLGFFLVYFVEELVHVVLHYTKHKATVHRTFSMRKSATEHEQDHENSNGDVVDMSDNMNSEENCCQNNMGCHNDMELSGKDEANNTSYNPKYQVRLSMTTNTMFPNYHAPETVVDAKSLESKITTPKRNSTVGKASTEPHMHVVQESNSVIKDIITVLALSFHAVFEGMAIGMEKEIEDVWKLFGSVAIHKFVITFCVCVELLQSNTKTSFYFLYLCTFAVVSPLGVGIGIGISSFGELKVLVSVMQGLAGGTIIYVVMFEVLQREKSKEVAGLPQLLAVFIGFSVILIIEILGAHDHEHGGHDHDHNHTSQLLADNMFDDHDHDHDHAHDHADHADDDHFHPGPMHHDFHNSSSLDFVPIEDHEHHDHHDHDHMDPVTDGYQVITQ